MLVSPVLFSRSHLQAATYKDFPFSIQKKEQISYNTTYLQCPVFINKS